MPGEMGSEPSQKFIFMFSQDGVDVFAIRTGDSSPTWSALLVFQEEQTRQEYVRSFIGAGAVSWNYFDNTRGAQDWKPIVSLKRGLLPSRPSRGHNRSQCPQVSTR